VTREPNPVPDRLLRVRVQPRSSRNAIGDELDGVLQVRVTAPPAGGAANAMVIKLLAKHLGLAKSRLEVVRGHKSREKTVRIRP